MENFRTFTVTFCTIYMQLLLEYTVKNFVKINYFLYNIYPKVFGHLNSLLGKQSADIFLKYFAYFSQKIEFDISCKLSP